MEETKTLPHDVSEYTFPFSMTTRQHQQPLCSSDANQDPLIQWVGRVGVEQKRGTFAAVTRGAKLTCPIRQRGIADAEMPSHVFWQALIDKQSSQRFIPPVPRIVRLEKELLIGRCIQGNLLDFMELRSEISASMGSRFRLSQAQNLAKPTNSVQTALDASSQHVQERF